MSPAQTSVRTSRTRRLLICLLPLPLAAAPLLVLLPNHSPLLPGRTLQIILTGPGIVADNLSGIAAPYSIPAMFISAGLIWYLAGVALLNSLIGRPGAVSRTILVFLSLATAFIALIAIG